MRSFSQGFSGVAWYELQRLVRKKSFWLVLALFVLPVVLALGLRNYLDVPEDPNIWATVFGLDITGLISGATGGALVFNIASILGLAWLIGILYGGDIFASDIQDGAIKLILARPVSRLTYTAAKLATVTGIILFFFLIGGISTYAAAWIMAGPQNGGLNVIAYSLLIGLGITPLLYSSALLGAYTRKAINGILLGFVGYMVGGIPASILVVLAIQGKLDLSILDAQALGGFVTPFTAGQKIASYLYTYLNMGSEVTVPGLEEAQIFHAKNMLLLSAASLVLWDLAILLFISQILSRRDL
ncbi:MAG: ABC transporter permease [Desulfurococcales archaeon]|nr:ABC transporter permease [Desulfurococcales archaeon]